MRTRKTRVSALAILIGTAFLSPAISKTAIQDVIMESPISRESVSFDVAGLSVSAWLYLPRDLSAAVPCIVMNNGFGGTKSMVLEPYALRFQEAGMAVLTYDYRYSGQSEGEPRQLLTIPCQLEDCAAAIRYARSRKEIDPDRIAVWGTSAGGGYGLVIAAQDERIACVCAQVAGFDSHEAGMMILKREGIGFLFRLFLHAQYDNARARLGLSAHRIPIVGRPGTLAVITAPGAFEGYARLSAEDFRNEVCARSILSAHGFNPIDHARQVHCPVLIQICEEDNLAPMGSAVETARMLGDLAEVKRYPIGHFDIYSGEHFERSVSDQIAFFKKHL